MTRTTSSGTDLRDVEGDDRRPTGADACDGGVDIDAVGKLVHGLDGDDGTFRVPATRLAEMPDHTPAEPRLVNAGAEAVDRAGDLAARRHRQIQGAGTDPSGRRLGSSCR
ncbi:MAG: hypothetical protein WKF58_09040 [Ilumatobacteraceae bacterium]